MSEAHVATMTPPRERRCLPLPLSLAVRELRAGLRGFYVFIACVALGVAVIAAVGALSDALRAGFESQGRRILGGDVVLTRIHRSAEPSERAWLASQGRLSETASMRAMARTVDASEQVLIELKGVDGAYPLVGSVVLSQGGSLDAALRQRTGAAVEPILLERLGLRVGDQMRLGNLELPVTGVIASEPDTVSDRLTFGPRVLVSLETLKKAGLVQPGSLIRWRYALDLSERGADPKGLRQFRDAVKASLPQAGFVVADRRDPSPQVTRTLDRLRQFLTLIGLTSLLVGGVGVANAVSIFIDRRRKVIATMKAVGARGRTIFAIFLAQVMLISGLGVMIGLALGYTLPVVLDGLYGDALPIRAEFCIQPLSVASAALYGFLVALVFALWPLGRAELVRAGVLFRDEVAPETRWPRPGVIMATAAAALVVLGLAVVTSEAPLLAFYFCGALVVVFAVFLAVGEGISRLARRLPRPRVPELALALGNLGGPGGLTRSVVLSLGAGLSLMVAVALTDAALIAELTSRLPQSSPNFFVLDIAKSDRGAFEKVVKSIAPDALIDEAPMLRGRLVRLQGVPVEQIKAPPQAQWVLSGDRGLSYAATVPQGSRVTAGSWWPPDYQGEPLVSFEQEIARDLGLKLGDTISVNVLGREVTARIANLREVNWESLAINFVMVFSPNTLQAAPHHLLATITLPPNASLETEARIAREVGRILPATTAIRVKDAINAFNQVFAKVMIAVRVAGSVTLLAGALVLAGALATAQRRRIQQAVILKTLGATRRRILAAHAAEYGVLAAIAAAVAVLLGTIASWIVVTQIMELGFVFAPAAVAQALAVALALVLAFGSIGTWQVLRAPSVPYLRSE